MTAAETAIDCLPTTWLDPLLTGPNAVIGRYPYTGDDIERLLQAIRDRIESLASGERVAVSRAELIEAARILAIAADGTHKHSVAMARLYGVVMHRWLSQGTPSERSEP